MRNDRSGAWKYKCLILPDNTLVEHSLMRGYFESAMKGIYDVETQIKAMMRRSKHWHNANKQFKG